VTSRPSLFQRRVEEEITEGRQQIDLDRLGRDDADEPDAEAENRDSADGTGTGNGNGNGHTVAEEAMDTA